MNIKNLINLYIIFIIKLFDTIIYEFKYILTSISVMTVIIGGNIIYAFLYPTPYLNDVVRLQNIAIVDDDSTTLSRQFIFNVLSTPQITIHSITSMQDAKDLLKRNQIYGILHIPRGFEEDSIKASIPNVYYIADASYFLIYGTIIEGLNNASQGLNINIKAKQALYRDINISNTIHQPIKWRMIPLYNPTIGYMNYTLAAILVFILHQTIIIACALIGGTQLQNHLKGNSRYMIDNSVFLIILARIFTFFVLYIPLFLFYFGFMYSFYYLNSVSTMLPILALGIAFVVSTTAFGIFVGSIFNKPQYAPQIIVVFSVPFIFTLGFIWPSELIPTWIKYIMNFVPITPTVDSFLKINQMGASFADIRYGFLHLICLLILYIALSYVIMLKKVQ